jgi:ABC-2 type transport system ATP-binding protein
LACDTPDNLRGLMRGTILEIRTDNARRAARVLRDRLPEASVGIFGDRVHLVTDAPASAGPEADSLLHAEGIGRFAIRQIEPSLEDVFVSVLTEHERHDN